MNHKSLVGGDKSGRLCHSGAGEALRKTSSAAAVEGVTALRPPKQFDVLTFLHAYQDLAKLTPKVGLCVVIETFHSFKDQVFQDFLLGLHPIAPGSLYLSASFD
jgi:hypothetical protein